MFLLAPRTPSFSTREEGAIERFSSGIQAMPYRMLLALLLLCLPTLSLAQTCPGLTQQLTAYAKEKLTVSTTPTALTASIYKPPGTTPAYASISLQGGDICYAVVGTPTTAECHPISNFATFPICGADSITAFKAITLNTDATIIVTYFKIKGP